jgi:hypothetical protein
LVPISWNSPISSGDGTEWLTLAVIDPSEQRKGGGKQGTIVQLDLSVLATCLDMFGVQIPDFRSAQPFTYRQDGQGSFIAENKKTGALYAVTTDFLSKTSSQMGGAQGQTDLNKPRYNWVASDFAKDPNVEGVAKQAAQIHEIGNSLGALTEKAPAVKNPRLRKIDSDAGMALEECVFGGYVNTDGSVFK